MTTLQGSLSPLDVPTLEEAIDPQLAAEIDRIGLTATLSARTGRHQAALVTHMADPMAADSRANYVGWLRRQASSWVQVPLPAVSVASLDWPLAAIRPQCLDVVGLLIADLRELSPGSRPMSVPRQVSAQQTVRPGLCVASAYSCLAAARHAAALLPRARSLTAGLTRVGSATRYLERCAELAQRVEGLGRDTDRWAAQAPAVELQLAVTGADLQLSRLSEVLEQTRRTGW